MWVCERKSAMLGLRGGQLKFVVVLPQVGHWPAQRQALAIKQQGQAMQVVALPRHGHAQAQRLHLFLCQGLGHGVHG